MYVRRALHHDVAAVGTFTTCRQKLVRKFFEKGAMTEIRHYFIYAHARAQSPRVRARERGRAQITKLAQDLTSHGRQRIAAGRAIRLRSPDSDSSPLAFESLIVLPKLPNDHIFRT